MLLALRVVYSFLSSLEIVVQSLFAWLPLYYEAKLLFVLWLILPQFKGAQFIFDAFVKPLMIKYGRNVNPVFDSAEKVMFSQQTAMIVDIARKYGTDIAKLAVQKAAEEAPRLAASPQLPQSQHAGQYGQHQYSRPAPPGFAQQSYTPMTSYAMRA